MGVSKEFSAAKWADNIIAIAEGRTVFGHTDNSREQVRMTIDNAFNAASWATEMFAKAQAEGI